MCKLSEKEVPGTLLALLFANLGAALNDALHDSASAAPLINSGEHQSCMAQRSLKMSKIPRITSRGERCSWNHEEMGNEYLPPKGAAAQQHLWPWELILDNHLKLGPAPPLEI